MLDRIRSVLGPQFTAAALTDVLERAHGDRLAVVLDSPLPYGGLSGDELTYGQIRQFVAKTASILRTSLGVGRGDRVVVCASGTFDELLAILAIFRVGAVAVPLLPETDPALLGRVLSDEGARVLVTDRAVWDRGPDRLGSPGPGLVFLGPRASVPETALSLDAALARASAAGDPDEVGGQDAIAVFRGPAGSALPWSPRTVLTSEGLTARGRPLALVQPRKGSGIVALPLADLMGFSSAAGALLAGMTLHHVARFEAERALEVIERRRPIAFFGAPWTYRAMAEVGLDGRDLSSVRLWGSATDRMPVDLALEFKRRGAMFRVGPWRTEAIFVDGFGTAELPGAAVIRLSPPGRREDAVVGIPIPPFKVKICDDAGHELARGEAGELWLRGPDPIPEDAESPARSVTSDGWLRTGELASQDFLGLLHFVAGRRSVIRSGGYTVQPAQIEQALASHPAVDGVIAFGVPHPTRREMPVAVVTAREGVLVEPDELLAWARVRLADHKAPRRIWIVSPAEIELATDRETQRAELRQRYLDTFLRV